MKVNVDDIFAYNISPNVTSDNEGHGLKSIKHYMKSNKLCKGKLFGLVVCRFEDVKLIICMIFRVKENYIYKIHMYRV